MIHNPFCPCASHDLLGLLVLVELCSVALQFHDKQVSLSLPAGSQPLLRRPVDQRLQNRYADNKGMQGYKGCKWSY